MEKVAVIRKFSVFPLVDVWDQRTVKISFLSNQGEIGGGEVMLLAMAEQVRQLGHDVVVVAPSTPSQVADRAREEGFEVKALPGSSRVSYAAALAVWARQADGLLWANGLFPSFVTAGKRRVVHLHQEPRSRAQEFFLKVARPRALAILVPSHFMASKIPGTRVLENWSELVRLPPPARPASPKRIGFAGRLSRDKGVDTLADAVALLRNEGQDVELVIAGEARFVDAEQAGAVERSLTQLGEAVTYLGWADRAEYLGQIDVAVVPSRWAEPFGLVATEAMSARVPLVVATSGALGEIVSDTYPWTFEAPDSVALAKALEAALGGDDETVERAHQRWQSQYSPEAGRERMAALLHDLEKNA